MLLLVKLFGDRMASKMYSAGVLFLISIVAVALANDDSSTSTTTTSLPPLQPIYQLPQQSPPYAQTYPDRYSMPLYDAFFYPQPVVPPQAPIYAQQKDQSIYAPAMATQGALQVVMKVLAKFGLFVLGGTALLLIGGIFTTILCNLTPICVISFPVFGGIDKESVRSLMTPDKISAAAAMVQDAIGKYQRLQRATKN